MTCSLCNREHQPRDRAVRCGLCGRPGVWDVHALCATCKHDVYNQRQDEVGDRLMLDMLARRDG